MKIASEKDVFSASDVIAFGINFTTGRRSLFREEFDCPDQIGGKSYKEDVKTLSENEIRDPHHIRSERAEGVSLFENKKRFVRIQRKKKKKVKPKKEIKWSLKL